MAIDWITVITAAVSGGLFGAAASLLVPWSQWGVEKIRKREERRTGSVDRWREAVRTMNEDRTQFSESAEYSSLRHLLRPEVREFVESTGIQTQLGGRGSGTDNFAPQVFDEIARIEKEWELL